MPRNYRYGIVCFIFFIPLLWIACTLDWEIDEAQSYVGILGSGWKDIVLYSKFKLANSHVINSLYFHCLQLLNVKGYLAYRFISLCSFVAYCAYLHKLLRQERYEFKDVSFIILFLLTPFVYFALARGYSFSYALFIAMLYHYKSYQRVRDSRNLLYFVLTGCVASLSIFSFYFPFCAMLALLFINCFRDMLKLVNLLILLLVVPVSAYVYIMGKVVVANDPLVIASDSLFKNGALSSLLFYMSLGSQAPEVVFRCCKLLVCISMVPVLVVMIKRRALYEEHKIAFATVAVMFLAHLFFHASYPMVRALMYLLPLMYLPLVYTGMWKDKWLMPHMVVISVAGLSLIGLYLRNTLRPTGMDVLKYVSKDNKPVVEEDGNPILSVYSKMYFNDTIAISGHELNNLTMFYEALDTSQYVVCEEPIMERSGKMKEFNTIYVMPHKSFYTRKH